MRVRVTTLTGDTSSFFTDPADGRLELPTLFSSQTRFKLTRKDFRSLDFMDTVSEAVDTVFHRPIARILKVRNPGMATADFRCFETGAASMSLVEWTEWFQPRLVEYTVVMYDGTKVDTLIGSWIKWNESSHGTITLLSAFFPPVPGLHYKKTPAPAFAPEPTRESRS